MMVGDEGAAVMCSCVELRMTRVRRGRLRRVMKCSSSSSTGRRGLQRGAAAAGTRNCSESTTAGALALAYKRMRTEMNAAAVGWS